jgi:hypothetical protein
MLGLVRAVLGRMRHRRRWAKIAAAATAAADRAMADLDRRRATERNPARRRGRPAHRSAPSGSAPPVA